MTVYQHKNKVGRFIFFSNLILFALIFIFYLISGFTNTEFGEIMKLLAPIKAVYLTALIKYVIANNNDSENVILLSKPVKKLYQTITSFMIYSHILSLIIVIALFALFHIMEFAALKNTISFLEIFFGLYIGLIMSDMFATDKKENTQENTVNK